MYKFKIILSLFITLNILASCDKNNGSEIPEGYSMGIVLENMSSGGYTYMNLDVDGQEIWIAAQEMEVSNGDKIYYKQGAMEMKDFHSKTLDRTFDVILFTDNATKDPGGAAAGDPHMMDGSENPHSNIAEEKVEGINVDPIEGGYTIEQLYQMKSDLAGNTVKVRGQVVKFNPAIMNMNWAHIQDGTGSKEECDLVITTHDNFEIGDVVEFEGALTINKDFGSGYNFSIIIEDATTINDMKKL